MPVNDSHKRLWVVIAFVQNDGGRAAAGFKGAAGDCVARAVAIASGRPYAEVYERLAAGKAHQRVTRRDRRRPQRLNGSGRHPRTAGDGVSTRRAWFADYMAELGFVHAHRIGVSGSSARRRIARRAPDRRASAIAAPRSSTACCTTLMTVRAAERAVSTDTGRRGHERESVSRDCWRSGRRCDWRNNPKRRRFMTNDNSTEKTMDTLKASVFRELSEKRARLLDRWREAGSPRIGGWFDGYEVQAWAILDPVGRRIALAGCRADAACDPQYQHEGDPLDPYGAAFEYSCCIPTAYDLEGGGFLPTVTSAEACVIANQIIAATCKHWDVIERSLCRPEGERTEHQADRTISNFGLFKRRGLDEVWVRDRLEIAIACVIELIVKLEDVGAQGAKPLVETLEGLVRQTIGWPWPLKPAA
jgi:hypothetical protein